MISLDEVTICAADCVTPELALLAIKKSLEKCRFAEAILFTDADSFNDEIVKCVRIEKMRSIDDYSWFMLKELHKFIKTKYVLVVQWDGYVVNPDLWQPCFNNFDYIGAKWFWYEDDMKIGNGGFSLRSAKLLKIMASNDFPFIPHQPEDRLIGRTYRERLVKEFGINFAPEKIADEFSYEVSPPSSPTFGFHGFFNIWRHIEGQELKELSEKLPTRIYLSTAFRELLILCLINRKLNSFKILFVEFVKRTTIKSFLKFTFRLARILGLLAIKSEALTSKRGLIRFSGRT